MGPVNPLNGALSMAGGSLRQSEFRLFQQNPLDWQVVPAVSGDVYHRLLNCFAKLVSEVLSVGEISFEGRKLGLGRSPQVELQQHG